MRLVRLTPEVERTLGDQLDYLVAKHATRAAVSLAERVHRFLATTLAEWPRTGRHIPERDIWESWIPRTNLVAWYRFTDDELVVITFWHTPQDRYRA